jgi:hypothetical protein
MAGMANMAGWAEACMGGMEEMMAGEYPQELTGRCERHGTRAKYQTISGRLKSKLDEKRKSAEVESIENGYRRRPAIRTISSLN